MTTKNIKEIISIQNYCKEIIQELYTYESRPYASVAKNIANLSKLEEAIVLEIIEHDSFDDTLSLSVDTEEYYRNRLGQSIETNIGAIEEKLSKIRHILLDYNSRVKSGDDTSKEIKSIHRLLNKIPSIFKYNLQAISSTSVFTFKNESNFEIKIRNLKICKKEIDELSFALKEVDRFIEDEWNFFRDIDDRKITFSLNKIRRNSADFESSFAQLHDDILNFINQSIEDGAFIKHLKRLKQLKYENQLKHSTNMESVVEKSRAIGATVKEKKILPDDRIYEYAEAIEKIFKARKIKIINKKKATSIDYDINKEVKVNKKLYNYPKIHKEFSVQDKDLITFLYEYPIQIEKNKLLGVYIRLLKNYLFEYEIEEDSFVEVDNRLFLKVYSMKRRKSIN